MGSSLPVIRVLLAILLSLFVLQPLPALSADEAGIPRAVNLAEVAGESQKKGLPLLVFVSRDACPYCRKLRESILRPMYLAKKFENRADIVELSLDYPGPLTGFDGETISAEAFGKAYKAGITPTLLFLDASGREIGQRRIGISNLDLYGFYLQKSIDEATGILKSRVE